MLLIIIFYIIIAPTCVLLHEIGHGLGAVFASKNHVHIYLGSKSEKNKEIFRLGRLHFHIIWSYIGFAYWEGELSKRQRAIALIGGPLMSLLLALLFGLLTLLGPRGDMQTLFWWITLVNFFQFAVTIIPMKYPRWMWGYSGHPSDGLQLLRLLKN
ncbi:hypothetical protein [Sporosarcina luteola]|uniref:hypothetical protein n=1 Tax=Sporosarcina luteola TaxID=582850 RepID=UPI00203DEFB8|nr:hypothetical protein [Sporosarcina luteola]MCM3711930.1 hypothetical protein [Sporosarcina luteola]